MRAVPGAARTVAAGLRAVAAGEQEGGPCRQSCEFALVALDVLVDESLRVWLLEAGRGAILRPGPPAEAAAAGGMGDIVEDLFGWLAAAADADAEGGEGPSAAGFGFWKLGVRQLPGK